MSEIVNFEKMCERIEKKDSGIRGLFSWDKDTIYFQIHPKQKYPIERDRVKTHQEVLDWIKHFLEKEIEYDVIYAFIELVECLNGWKSHGYIFRHEIVKQMSEKFEAL